MAGTIRLLALVIVISYLSPASGEGSSDNVATTTQDNANAHDEQLSLPLSSSPSTTEPAQPATPAPMPAPDKDWEELDPERFHVSNLVSPQTKEWVDAHNAELQAAKEKFHAAMSGYSNTARQWFDGEAPSPDELRDEQVASEAATAGGDGSPADAASSRAAQAESATGAQDPSDAIGVIGQVGPDGPHHPKPKASAHKTGSPLPHHPVSKPAGAGGSGESNSGAAGGSGRAGESGGAGVRRAGAAGAGAASSTHRQSARREVHPSDFMERFLHQALMVKDKAFQDPPIPRYDFVPMRCRDPPPPPRVPGPGKAPAVHANVAPVRGGTIQGKGAPVSASKGGMVQGKTAPALASKGGAVQGKVAAPAVAANGVAVVGNSGPVKGADPEQAAPGGNARRFLLSSALPSSVDIFAHHDDDDNEHHGGPDGLDDGDDYDDGGHDGDGELYSSALPATGEEHDHDGMGQQQGDGDGVATTLFLSSQDPGEEEENEGSEENPWASSSSEEERPWAASSSHASPGATVRPRPTNSRRMLAHRGGKSSGGVFRARPKLPYNGFEVPGDDERVQRLLLSLLRPSKSTTCAAVGPACGHTAQARAGLRLGDGSLGSCAIVGLGRNVMDAFRGREIDAHDTVFRFGFSSPTHGFEEHVGRKTDVFFLRRPMLRAGTTLQRRNGKGLAGAPPLEDVAGGKERIPNVLYLLDLHHYEDSLQGKGATRRKGRPSDGEPRVPFATIGSNGGSVAAAVASLASILGRHGGREAADILYRTALEADAEEAAGVAAGRSRRLLYHHHRWRRQLLSTAVSRAVGPGAGGMFMHNAMPVFSLGDLVGEGASGLASPIYRLLLPHAMLHPDAVQLATQGRIVPSAGLVLITALLHSGVCRTIDVYGVSKDGWGNYFASIARKGKPAEMGYMKLTHVAGLEYFALQVAMANGLLCLKG